jgi:ribonucleotide monophosphatase NagD (HAD superfamily)
MILDVCRIIVNIELYRCRGDQIVRAVAVDSARLLGADAIAHVGDSFFHDVCGAAAAEIPVVFVAGGIDYQDHEPYRRATSLVGKSSFQE